MIFWCIRTWYAAVRKRWRGRERRRGYNLYLVGSWEVAQAGNTTTAASIGNSQCDIISTSSSSSSSLAILVFCEEFLKNIMIYTGSGFNTIIYT